jgi:hypothetical protein
MAPRSDFTAIAIRPASHAAMNKVAGSPTPRARGRQRRILLDSAKAAKGANFFEYGFGGLAGQSLVNHSSK